MELKNAARLALCVLACQSAGLIGSIFTFPSIPSWYASLSKPFFTPPSWLFAPVWVLLFALMGVSLYLVSKNGFRERKTKIAGSVFGVQLFLNALWSFLFFGLRSPLWAFAEIILLWFAILATIFHFRRVSRTAALLLLPYLLWVSFAAVLNFAIMGLNP